MTSTKPKTGVIGIGRMGFPMSERLIAAGHALLVHDTDPAAVAALAGGGGGAGAADSPAAVAAGADVILLSLPTPEIVERVAFGPRGLAATPGAGKVVVDLSTTGPEGARALAKGLAEAGYRVADCPVSGGVAGARKGALAMMAACDRALYDELRPLLDVLGRPFLVGPEPGMGQMVKVLNNLVSVATLAITSEALVLGTKAGLDPAVMVDVINASSGQSNASMTKVPRNILTRNFDFGFALGLSAKDVRLCLEESETAGVPMIVGAAVRELLRIGRAQLGPDADLTEIIKPIEAWAGVTVGRPPDAG